MKSELLSRMVLATTLLTSLENANADVYRTKTINYNGCTKTIVQRTVVRDNNYPILHTAGVAVTAPARAVGATIRGAERAIGYAAGTSLRAARASVRGAERAVGATTRGTLRALDAALPPYHHHHY